MDTQAFGKIFCSIFDKYLEGNSQAITFALPIQLLDFSSRVRLRVRTPPFHGGDTGSNPVRGTKKSRLVMCGSFCFLLYLLS
jgi:hypothetical protein